MGENTLLEFNSSRCLSFLFYILLVRNSRSFYIFILQVCSIYCEKIQVDNRRFFTFCIRTHFFTTQLLHGMFLKLFLSFIYYYIFQQFKFVIPVFMLILYSFFLF
uniref:Transmembrane protein n=1 Tax=Cacopsylla melanoneura TaxID=428564 RepID=A0A8D8SXL0_9HEMI